MTYHVPATAEFASLGFREMVTDIAGRALGSFVQGTAFHSVIHTAVQDACAWRMSQPDVIKAMNAAEKAT